MGRSDPTPDRTVAALFGPTSSGKTALSVGLAQLVERELGRPVVIISADSRQVYRHLDIGTSKTTPEQMGGIRHEMLDVAEPTREFGLEAYLRMARRHIADAFASGGVPFIVGGTGIYLQALLSGWETEGVDAVGAAREALRRDFPRSMAAEAYATLRRLDPAAAARIHRNNHQAVINALATAMAGSGRPESSGRASAPRAVLLGLDPGDRTLRRRVADTYDDQVRRGLFEEVRVLEVRYRLLEQLRRRGPDSTNRVLHTHGYREYFEVAHERGRRIDDLDGEDLREVRRRVVDHIRAYTRRQRSWFAKLPDVHRLDPTGSTDPGDPVEPVERAGAVLLPELSGRPTSARRRR